MERLLNQLGNAPAQNVIVVRTNSSFSGLNTVMNFAPSLVITKEQVDKVVAWFATYFPVIDRSGCRRCHCIHQSSSR